MKRQLMSSMFTAVWDELFKARLEGHHCIFCRLKESKLGGIMTLNVVADKASKEETEYSNPPSFSI